MRILGISAFQRDAAAALVIDGAVVAAAQEERFTRLTLDPAFPQRAIRWCLAAANLRGHELDRVVFYEKPLRKFERVLARALQRFPASALPFAKSAFLWLGERLWIKNRIAQELELAPERVLFLDQARAQLAHAYYASGFDEAALLLVDDVCEWTSTALGHARGKELELLLEIHHPHSLGLFASALTQFLGFVPGEEEHKLEALAAFGRPRRVAELARFFGGSGAEFQLAREPFRFDDGAERLFGPELERALGPARHSGEALRFAAEDGAHADLAASVQQVLEEHALALARELARRTGSTRLCVAGLLAQNRGLLARLAAEAPFRQVFAPSAPGKAGGAVGAALFAQRALEGARPDVGARAGNLGACDWGETIDARAEPGARELGGDGPARAELLRRLLAGELVGWARGGMEFGVRSLGRRVALALPRGAENGARLHAALKHVESFLPLRLAVPAERAAEFFALPSSAAALAELGHVFAPASERLRALLPGAPRPDGRVWPQLVRAEADAELHALLVALGETCATPLLWLTDLALRGSPLVRTEADAVEAFGRSELDALIAGSRVYVRA